MNGLGQLLGRLGIQPPHLVPAALRRRARKKAGCDDYWDADLETALGVLLDSVERDANLSLVGRFALRDLLVDSIANRLLFEATRRSHPELFATELRPPLIIVGLPRTGTTLLHRLLALADDARALLQWELNEPIAPAGIDRRLESARESVNGYKVLVPALDRQHFLTAETPEECMALFSVTLVSAQFWVVAPVHGYQSWELAQDKQRGYAIYAQYLSYFQAQDPSKRLTLKAPAHTRYLRELFDNVPNALVVQTHRHPVAAQSSQNSLFHSLYSALSNGFDVHELGRRNLDLLVSSIEACLACRAEQPERRIVDVYYDDLVADPVGTVASIHQQFSLPFTAAHRQRIEAYMRDNRQHKHGRHDHVLEDFGLTESQVLTRYSSYLERFPRLAQ